MNENKIKELILDTIADREVENQPLTKDDVKDIIRDFLIDFLTLEVNHANDYYSSGYKIELILKRPHFSSPGREDILGSANITTNRD